MNFIKTGTHIVKTIVEHNIKRLGHLKGHQEHIISGHIMSGHHKQDRTHHSRTSYAGHIIAGRHIQDT